MAFRVVFVIFIAACWGADAKALKYDLIGPHSMEKFEKELLYRSLKIPQTSNIQGIDSPEDDPIELADRNAELSSALMQLYNLNKDGKRNPNFNNVMRLIEALESHVKSKK
ncbi:hypothetical protein ABEB36_012600 [Hypothenemus hampei]|uniref:Uncharacterized protein n=1 Tax=Hypothenemus hampei TaxID=57062 RepID=A0ABD1EEJ2_HYPHA